MNSEKKEQNFEYEQTSKLRPGDRRARQAKQRTPGAHPPATSLARERNRRAKVNMIPTCVRACAVYLHSYTVRTRRRCGHVGEFVATANVIPGCARGAPPESRRVRCGARWQVLGAGAGELHVWTADAGRAYSRMDSLTL